MALIRRAYNSQGSVNGGTGPKAKGGARWKNRKKKQKMGAVEGGLAVGPEDGAASGAVIGKKRKGGAGGSEDGRCRVTGYDAADE